MGIYAHASIDLTAEPPPKPGRPIARSFQALFHGKSLGGARPKASVEDKDKKYIAKFSTSSDVYNAVKAEYIAMRLAQEVGLNVAPVEITRAAGKDNYPDRKISTG